jgi:spore maturation protein CgeB
MNQRLVEVAHSEKPDLMFTVLMADELDPAAIRSISGGHPCPTLNWFCDDHYRFESFTRRWAPAFDYVVTTTNSALAKYQAMGYRNVIKSQWACNHFLYRKVNLPLKYDVTFVGQPHGNRRELVRALKMANIDVKTWGTGWDTGRLSQDKMIKIFNSSCINLNFSNAASPERSATLLRNNVAKFFRRTGLMPIAKKARRLVSLNPFITRQSVTRMGMVRYLEQIKGRNFEVPGCGGFLLTAPAENLDSYYVPGRELASFDTVGELIDKVRYFLANEAERVTIAEAGYQRTIREHTYAHRFADIFKHMGFNGDNSAVSEQVELIT